MKFMKKSLVLLVVLMCIANAFALPANACCDNGSHAYFVNVSKIDLSTFNTKISLKLMNLS